MAAVETQSPYSTAWNCLREARGPWIAIGALLAITEALAIGFGSFLHDSPQLTHAYPALPRLLTEANIAFQAVLGLVGINMALEQLEGERPSFGRATVLPIPLPQIVLFVVAIALWETAMATTSFGGWGFERVAWSLLGVYFLFVGPVMIAERKPFAGAVRRSIDLVSGHYLETLQCAVGFGVLSFVGLLALGVGVLFTAPFYLVAMAVLYTRRLELENDK